MNSIKKLKEDKERLSRDLADSCRQVVDLQFAYQDLHIKYKEQKETFAKFLVKNKHVDSMSSAIDKVEEIIQADKEPEQLDLPLKMENNLY